MFKERIALYHSKLGFKLIGVALLSAALSIILFLGFSALGNSIQNTALFNEFVREEDYVAGIISQFQDYVTVNQINSTDYLEVKVWLSGRTGIGFIYDDTNTAEMKDGSYPVRFADKTVYVMPYASSTRYSGLIRTSALVVAITAFILIMGAFVRNVISDVKHLSREMVVLAGGDLNHPVLLTRNGELSDLAKHMDDMRRSMIERIQREDEAIEANRDLITALSHDLRTPLTKQMGYLEVAMAGKYDTDLKSLHACLSKIHKATLQIKERSEELFAYFLVFGEKKPPALEMTDGQLLLAQMLEDQTGYLESNGFTLCTEPLNDPFTLQISIPYLSRVLDNIISNIVKYADKDKPVMIRHALSPNQFQLTFENTIYNDVQHIEGTQIGLRSAQRLVELMHGEMQTSIIDDTFSVGVKLPVYAQP